MPGEALLETAGFSFVRFPKIVLAVVILSGYGRARINTVGAVADLSLPVAPQPVGTPSNDCPGANI